MENIKLYFTQQLTEDAKFSCYVQDSDGANFKASTEITLDLIGKYSHFPFPLKFPGEFQQTSPMLKIVIDSECLTKETFRGISDE